MQYDFCKRIKGVFGLVHCFYLQKWRWKNIFFFFWNEDGRTFLLDLSISKRPKKIEKHTKFVSYLYFIECRPHVGVLHILTILNVNRSHSIKNIVGPTLKKRRKIIYVYLNPAQISNTIKNGVWLRCNGNIVSALHPVVGSMWMNGSNRIQWLGTTVIPYYHCTVAFSLKILSFLNLLISTEGKKKMWSRLKSSPNKRINYFHCRPQAH